MLVAKRCLGPTENVRNAELVSAPWRRFVP
jgi:hypothetical protein